jgi:hypothetical protein
MKKLAGYNVAAFNKELYPNLSRNLETKPEYIFKTTIAVQNDSSAAEITGKVEIK